MKSRATRAWLLEDERGAFENDALVYLAYTAKHYSGAPVGDIDAAIAQKIALSALEAMLEFSKKQKPRRKV